MKSGFYTTTSDDQLCGQTEKKLQSTSQSQTCTKKKVMVTVLWSAVVLIHDSFLNPSETISKSEKYAQQIDEMHWKPESLNACSQHWPIERAQFFCRQCPTACHTVNTSTVEWIGVQSFASSSICAQSCPTPFSRLDLSNLKSKHSASCRPQGPNPGSDYYLSGIPLPGIGRFSWLTYFLTWWELDWEPMVYIVLYGPF